VFDQEEQDIHLLEATTMLAATTDMNFAEKVGNIAIKNQGGFHVRMDFQFIDPRGSSSRLRGSRKTIRLGRTETQDPGNYGLTDGALFTVHADVEAGSSKTGTIWLRYEKNNKRIARFLISGTTLDNELGFNGIRN